MRGTVTVTFTAEQADAVEKAIRRTLDWLSFTQGEGLFVTELKAALWLFPKVNGVPHMPKPHRRGLTLDARKTVP